MADRWNSLIRFQKKQIIIIDVLDECDNKEFMKKFIEAIIYALQVNYSLPINVLITSRVEKHIRELLQFFMACLTICHLFLSEFNARANIYIFLQSSLSEIYNKKCCVMLNVLTL